MRTELQPQPDIAFCPPFLQHKTYATYVMTIINPQNLRYVMRKVRHLEFKPELTHSNILNNSEIGICFKVRRI